MTFVATSLAASFICFGRLESHDDEGWVMLWLREVQSGRALYDEVDTIYGPGYFLVTSALVALGLDIDHRSARLLTLVSWLVAAGLLGLTIWRKTRSPLLTGLVILLAGRTLKELSNEPLHPQVLTVPLLVILLYLAVEGPAARRRWRLVLQGCAVALLVTTKINLGAFALIALGLAFFAATPGRLARALRWTWLVGVLLLPWVLMKVRLGSPWARELALFFTFALLPLACDFRRAPATKLDYRAWGWAFLGLGVTAALCVAYAPTTGTGPAGLLHGLLLQHMGWLDVWAIPFHLPAGALLLAGLSALSGLAYLTLTHLERARPARALGRAAQVALVVSTLGALGSKAQLVAYALPWTWAALTGSRERHFARMTCAALIVLHALILFPVAGSQVGLAAFALHLPAALCAHDLWTELRDRSSEGLVPTRLTFALSTLALAAAAGLSLVKVAGLRARYLRADPLLLPGCAGVRVPPETIIDAATWAWVFHNLEAHSDVFLSKPGFNSLYLWTGREPAFPYNLSNWAAALPPARQREAARVFAEFPRACAVINERMSRHWLKSAPPDQERPLVDFLEREFRTVARVGTTELAIRRGRPAPELVYCARPGSSPRELLVSLPALAGVARQVRVRAPWRQVRAAPELELADDAEGWLPRDLGREPLSLESPRRLRLLLPTDWTWPPEVEAREGLRVELRDDAGRCLAVLPLISAD
ncbi:MAG TPA: hypothetical protein DEA08_38630 [Planctomycetes bacterium]|nr:hypothetical protein [Planctomycetota bacterium]